MGLADYYDVLPDYAPFPQAEMSLKARAAAQKALAIDDSIAEAHATLADSYSSQWDWSTAEREFNRALELNPNSANTHKLYWLYLSLLARHEEALDQIKEAVRLDPLNLKSLDNLGQEYANSREYDLAIEQFKKVIDMDPTFASVHLDLASVYFDLHKYDLWIQESETGYRLANQPEYEPIFKQVASVYARSGEQAAVHEWAKQEVELSKRRYEDSAYIGFILAQAGDKGQAFAWLEKAFAEKSDQFQYVKISHLVDPLRSDPRYTALLKGMGRPQ